MPEVLTATVLQLLHAAWIVAGVTIALITIRGAVRFHRAGMARLRAVSRETGPARPGAADWSRFDSRGVL